MNVTDSTPAFWNSLNTGDLIILSDSQAIEQDMNDNNEIDGIEYAIKSIDTYTVEGDLATFKYFNIKDMAEKSQDLVFLVKIVDSNVDLFVFFQVEDIPLGNRLDFMEQGLEFFFSNHEEAEELLDLEYNGDLHDPNGNVYSLQMQTMGEVTHEPAESGCDDPLLFQVVEYMYDGEEDVENERLMVTEEGDGEQGGLIKLFSGTVVTASNVEVYKGATA